MDEDTGSLTYFYRQKPDVYGYQERHHVKGEVQTLSLLVGINYQKKAFFRHCEADGTSLLRNNGALKMV